MTEPAVSVERFADLLCDLAFDALSLLDETGAVRATSDKAGELVGTLPGHAQKPGTFGEPHPEDLAEALKLWNQLLASPGVRVRSCLRMKHKDGTWRWIEVVGRNLLRDPQIQRVVINWRDVTAARQTEHALRISEARSQLIAESSHDLILWISADGTLTYVSPRSQAVLGSPPEALVGSNFYQRVHPDDADAVRQSHAAAAGELLAVPTYRCRRSDGSWIWLESNVRRLPESMSGEIVAVACDITHTRKSDEQFLQAQKMDAVGRLAGGVAHDFNNLLSIIISAGSLLHDELGPNHPSLPMTDEIRIACKRAADLTRQLLAFSRRQMLVPEAVSVNTLLDDALAEVRPAFGPKVELVTELDPQVGQISVDGLQVSRVLVNLLLNANEAMPEGGQLKVTTSNVKVTSSDLDGAADVPLGEYVKVGIIDTGIGMTPITQAHLFEPFFTTKPRGKGVGLGLATAYGIVRQSNGHFRVFSEPGLGASFFVLFPRTGRAAQMPAAAAPTPQPAQAGNETILLVEDDSAVRRVAAALLAKKGYRVLQAEGGREALAMADGELKAVQLLLTDVLMPEMTGPEIAAALKEKVPALKVLFMSGQNNEGVHNILHKPFTLETLSRRVREVLDQ